MQIISSQPGAARLPKDYAKQYRDALKHDASLGAIGWGLGSAVFWVFVGIWLGGAL